MSSKIPKTQGGGFGKQSRFHAKGISTPGPIYYIPSLFTEHAQGPIYKAGPPRPHDILSKTLPHPSKDRTAWMIGTTKEDLAYFSNIAAMMGPALYETDPAPIKRRNERAVFGRDTRFRSITKQYISKEHNEANLCTAGPGPKYYSETHGNMLTTDKQPHYSFRSKGDNVSDRGSFLKQSVIDGYIYQARPSTSDPGVNVGPSNYSGDHNNVKDLAPRPVWGKADRFKPTKKIFFSKKHLQDMKGQVSPGPRYHPTNYDMSLSKRVGVPKEGVFIG